jgi:hypothetical protein
MNLDARRINPVDARLIYPAESYGDQREPLLSISEDALQKAPTVRRDLRC